MVLRGGHHRHPLAVAEGQYRELLAVQPLLDYQLGAGLAEHAAAQQLVHEAYRLGRRTGQKDTLAGGEPGALDDEWPRRLPYEFGRGLEVIGSDKTAIVSRWYAEPSHHVLGEGLGRLEPGGQPAGAETQYPSSRQRGALGQRIGKAKGERRLRPDDDQVDRLIIREVDDRGDVGGADRNVPSARPGTTIARRDTQPADQGRFGQLPGKRMLAAARSNNQYSHGTSNPFLPATPAMSSG